MASTLLSFIRSGGEICGTLAEAERREWWLANGLGGYAAGALRRHAGRHSSLSKPPLSGVSMNPARSFGSALPGELWNGLWVYFTAPPLGMLLAAECYMRVKGQGAVLCCKLHHENDKRCIFRCGYGESAKEKAQ